VAAVVQSKHAYHSGGGTALSLTLDSTPTNGNTLYAWVSNESTFSAPSGWSSVIAVTDVSGFTGLFVGLFSKVVSGDGTSVSSATVSTNHGGITVIEISSAGTGTLGTAYSNSFQSDPIPVPGQSVSAANAVHLLLAAAGNDFGGTGTALAPTNFTIAGTATANRHNYMAYDENPATGASGDINVECGKDGTAYGRGYVIENSGGGGGTFRTARLPLIGVGRGSFTA
jgi:hypothetical protein